MMSSRHRRIWSSTCESQFSTLPLFWPSLGLTISRNFTWQHNKSIATLSTTTEGGILEIRPNNALFWAEVLRVYPSSRWTSSRGVLRYHGAVTFTRLTTYIVSFSKYCLTWLKCLFLTCVEFHPVTIIIVFTRQVLFRSNTHSRRKKEQTPLLQTILYIRCQMQTK